MNLPVKPHPLLLIVALGGALVACGGGESPAPPPAPVPASSTPAPAAEIKAPAGRYKLDPDHASLIFKIRHLGLADYAARFTRFDATLTLDPQDLAKSSVTATIDPTSVRTDYAGDYRAGHKDSPYQSFEEALAKDAKFLRAGEFPTIEFRSTRVEPQKDGRLQVTGDLTFLGQTHPLTLDVVLVGSMEKHPGSGRGAIGFAATGTLKRSIWGMTELLQYLADDVSLQFDGEFQQADAAEPSGPAA